MNDHKRNKRTVVGVVAWDRNEMVTDVISSYGILRSR